MPSWLLLHCLLSLTCSLRPVVVPAEACSVGLCDSPVTPRGLHAIHHRGKMFLANLNRSTRGFQLAGVTQPLGETLSRMNRFQRGATETEQVDLPAMDNETRSNHIITGIRRSAPTRPSDTERKSYASCLPVKACVCLRASLRDRIRPIRAQVLLFAPSSRLPTPKCPMRLSPHARLRTRRTPSLRVPPDGRVFHV